MIKLQVKVISWPFIILTAFLRVLQIESINTNFLELAAFEDFLRSEHLSQVLVVRGADADADGGGGGGGDWHTECHQKLLANYRVQFYRPGMSANFEDLSFRESPRLAVLVLNFEHILVRRRVLGVASEAGYFNNSLAWFILGSGRESLADEQLIEQHLSGYSMGIDADITVALRSPDNTSWNLYDVYRINQQVPTPLMIERKGKWSASGGYQVMENFKNTLVIRRRNFGNITLSGSTVLTDKPPGFDSMEYLADDKQLLQLDAMQRKTYQLFQLVERMFNLRLVIVFTDKWGELLENGSWSGVMGQVTSRAADLAVCPIRFLLDRHPYVQYSPALHIAYIHFIFRHPRHSHISNIFFEPLSNQVWWCVLVLVTGSTLLLLMHVRQERVLSHVESRLSFVWFTILEAYLQQGPAPEAFRLFSTRLLISLSGIFSFILMQFYGAFIVGSLLTQSLRSIVSLQALYDSNLAIGMENIPYNFHIFNSSIPLVRQVYAKKICRAGEHNILTLQQGAERIIQGRFAFHADLERMYRLLLDLRMDEGQFCELQEIQFDSRYDAASIMPRGSPWREHLAHALLHLRASGLKQYNDRKWMVTRPDCSLVRASQAEVDLEHFAPALFALVLAMMASAVVFLLELFLHWLPDFQWRLGAMST
ncbi:glutamate [NMDA] receptor subunit 1 [Drosophila gunungcola]|uniref:glutamate [NMDA] receptor subunit 1 n=1 Tax=Drosophila gunungcola TaxID=103775 RepID=UPI0022E609A4|nr:glutamate [NMDA] receptor subunit 1 [Drosophila gunungcola]